MKFINKNSIKLVVISITISLTAILPITKVSATNVKPIQWSNLSKNIPNDLDSKRIEEILVNTNKYALTTWWNAKFSNQSNVKYLSLGGTSEKQVRHPAAMLLGLSTSLSLNVYDETKTGVSEEEAINKSLQLISSLAYNHKANQSGGWGDHWQSAHWAHFTGLAGWLMWDKLSAQDQQLVANMVEYEANRFIGYNVPYYQAQDGTLLSKGDTKAEENAWNAQILQLATAMMPSHENWQVWMDKSVELMISAGAAPSDLTNHQQLNGKAVQSWLEGSNINENGTVTNHGFIHPDYMEFILFNNTAALTYTLANMETPKAAFFNSDKVYRALVDLSFSGGTIYREGSSDIYYPEGNDWGTDRRMQFANMDIFASIFGYDNLVGTKGDYWEDYHAQKVLDMQRRHEDARTYSSTTEDTYHGREEWVAHHAAWSYLAKWINHNGAFKTTDRSYGISSERLAGENRYQTAVDISKEGWIESSTVVITRGNDFPDALAGAPLAYKKNAPILLTETKQLSPETKAEIIRLKAKQAIILGGPQAVSDSVKKSINDLGLEVSRISGADRFETAEKIAQHLPADTAIIAYGYNFPDALAASSIAAENGYPILLTEKNKVPASTERTLGSKKKTIVVGGQEVISHNVSSKLPSPTRVGGADRFETAQKIVDHFYKGENKVMMANGTNFPDALTGSVLAAKDQAFLLLTERDNLPASSLKIVKSYPIEHATILGGNEVIQENLIPIINKSKRQ
ncbi:cell wall-binding repeat-containing protein [Bacillus carboniphilus]|uniref:Cell wall-binding repeat-containing protein n=1 Tax=Bacillus carboniphilus TaxID=86663 RepID=A0ABY9JQC3_9BACI|nr:cell wall-binding repeat-containing protein [Bacillus carboniphilus]WLR41601.1 cell wall-binding repeat-containing protein [Bacillus carboniphilus]